MRDPKVDIIVDLLKRLEQYEEPEELNVELLRAEEQHAGELEEFDVDHDNEQLAAIERSLSEA